MLRLLERNSAVYILQHIHCSHPMLMWACGPLILFVLLFLVKMLVKVRLFCETFHLVFAFLGGDQGEDEVMVISRPNKLCRLMCLTSKSLFACSFSFRIL